MSLFYVFLRIQNISKSYKNVQNTQIWWHPVPSNFGDDVKIRRFSLRRGWFRRRLSVLGAGDTQISEISENLTLSAISAVESKALWSRYGL